MFFSDGFICFIGYGKLLLIGMKYLELNDVMLFVFYVLVDVFFRVVISFVVEVLWMIGKIIDLE